MRDALQRRVHGITNHVEQADRRKEDLQVGEYANEDDHRSAAREHPSGHRTPIKGQQGQSDHQRNERQTKGVRSPPVLEAARDLHRFMIR